MGACSSWASSQFEMAPNTQINSAYMPPEYCGDWEVLKAEYKQTCVIRPYIFPSSPNAKWTDEEKSEMGLCRMLREQYEICGGF